MNPLRVALADDSALFRDGLAALLTAAGVDVVGVAADVPGAHAVAAAQRPDVVVLDVRMPPTHTDEGIRAAVELHSAFPGLGVLVLSTYAESEWVTRLLAGGADRLGYLMKDRVDDVQALVEALHRVAAGGTAVDPELVSKLVGARVRGGGLDRLTAREREVLALMAEGMSNAGIGRRLYLAPKTVEAHVARIFLALGLQPDSDGNRRVRAVITFLRQS
jgi:DNA-binding NarL/FixJ family response regulator